MGLNNKRGRIPNSVKEHAVKYVDECGGMAYHYACYDTAFGPYEGAFTELMTEQEYRESQTYDYQLIDCIVRELKRRGIWLTDEEEMEQEKERFGRLVWNTVKRKGRSST